MEKPLEKRQIMFFKSAVILCKKDTVFLLGEATPSKREGAFGKKAVAHQECRLLRSHRWTPPKCSRKKILGRDGMGGGSEPTKGWLCNGAWLIGLVSNVY